MLQNFKGARALLKNCRRTLLLFEMIYKFLAGWAVVPLCFFLFQQALEVSGLHYVSSANLAEVFTNGWILAALLIILVLMAFFSLTEVAGLILIFEAAHENRVLKFGRLFLDAVRTAGRGLLPQNWPLVLCSMLLLPLTGVSFASGFISEIRIPDYIEEILMGEEPHRTIFIAATALLSIIVLMSLFIFHVFVLERRASGSAFVESLRIWRGRILKTLCSLLLWQAGVSVLVALVQGALELVGLFVPYWAGLAEGTLSYEMWRAAADFVGKAAAYLGSIVMIYCGYAIISAMYYSAIGQPMVELLPAERPIGFRERRWVTPVLAVGGALILSVQLGVLWLARDLDVVNASLGTSYTHIGVTAHRGGNPENTLAAFQQAIDAGADYAELDVQQTKDGVVVVTHDSMLKRTSGKAVNIYDLTFEEARALDVGSPLGYAPAQIPTLEEVLELCKDKIKLVIEIKPNGHDQELERRTLELIDQYAFAEDCIVSSLQYDVLQTVKSIAPEQRTMYLMSVAHGRYYELENVDVFSLESTFVTSDAVYEIHSRGGEVFVWTIDSADTMRRMIDLGVDNIITNRVATARAMIAEREAEDRSLLESLVRDSAAAKTTGVLGR